MIDEETSKKIDRIGELVTLLNYYRDMYYNRSLSEISDKEYDELFDELKQLELETHYVLANSPTVQVGYVVKSELTKKAHNHPMLSLDKTKSPKDIVNFLTHSPAVCMAKMDGLTLSLRYLGGKLISAETRGDGEVGEDVTHNARVIETIPDWIDCQDEVIIDGEIIATKFTFDRVNKKLPKEERYKHIRNYASGSIRQLDSKICKDRNLTFVAWKLVKGYWDNSFYARWKKMIDWGFRSVPLIPVPEGFTNESDVTTCVDLIKKRAEEYGYPIDGCVFGFDDVAYGESLGATSHHLKSQMAFKFYDETIPTKLIGIDWTIGKTGALTPTAMFEPVEIDGTSVTRASLHNISIIKELGLTEGCTVNVYKANMIIPQIESCESDGVNSVSYPYYCPICGAPTEIKCENNSEVLVCTNNDCAGKKLMKFENFVARKCANIDGLSEATLQLLLSRGYIHTYKDLYYLSDYADEMKQIEGFGEKSVNKLLKSIEKSRHIKLENYINALGIDGIGLANAKAISSQFNNDYAQFKEALDTNFNFTLIEGFGAATQIAINLWKQQDTLCKDLDKEFIFEKPEEKSDASLNGLRFCITGTFSESRDILKEKLESKGAVFVSGVSKNLDILFVGEKAGSKLDKAKELGVKTANEKELFEMLK